MASVAHLLKDAENIIDEIAERLSLVEKYSVKHYVNARIIQKHFRGYIERKHIKLLNEKATCIQKNWRAFLGRILYRRLLKKKFHEMCWAYYYKMATIIQKSWRGYWTRSSVFSFDRLRSWLSFIAQQNKNFKCLARASQNKNNAIEMKQREVEAKEWIVYILFKLHHLLRTHQLSGIYSLPNTTELSEIEKMLKGLKYKDFMIFYNAYMEDLRQEKAKELPPYIFQHCKMVSHFEREYHEYKKTNKNAGDYCNDKKIKFDMELMESSRNKVKENDEISPKNFCLCDIQVLNNQNYTNLNN